MLEYQIIWDGGNIIVRTYIYKCNVKWLCSFAL